MEQFGAWSVLPPLIAIVLAFFTKQVLPSLFISIFVGSLIISHGNPFTAFDATVIKYLSGSLTDPWKANVITFDIALGGMIGVVAASGGALAIAMWLGKRARTPRSGQIVTWLMGLIIFFDDYSNTLLVGNTMRPLTDKLKISREKLSYICDSTAAPVASMALISTWIAFEMGLLKDAFAKIGVSVNAYEAFLKSLPFRFYSITGLFFVLAVAWLGRDFGLMLIAELRARKTGKLVADGSTPLASKELTEMELKEGIPLRSINAIVPVLTVVITVLIGLYMYGYHFIVNSPNTAWADQIRSSPLAFTSIRDCFGKSNAPVVMVWASFLGSFVAFIMVLSQKILTFQEAIEAWVKGAKALIMALMVLMLAWGIGSVCKDLGTAQYIVDQVKDHIRAEYLPSLIFLISCVIAFATGTSWGTSAIMMPIAVPLAFNLGGIGAESLMFATIGAVFTGAVFGDHCSPISDTTVMSSMASASDHIDHVKTQIPYALATAGIALFAGYLPTSFGVPVGISLVACIGLAFLTVRIFGQKVDP